MANIGNITKDSSTSDFLSEGITNDLADSFKSGKIANINEELTQKLNAEKEHGLSLDALSIEGRAPLNEITNEMIARINVTVQDIEDIQKITKAKGYQHQKQEADRFVREVIGKEYKKLCDKAETETDAYNSSTKDVEEKDSEGNTKTVTKYPKDYGHYVTVKLPESYDQNTVEITWTGSFDSSFDHASAAEAACKAAKDWFNGKVKEAIDFYGDSNKLEIPNAGEIPMPVPDDEERPEGLEPGDVQPGAKRIVTGDTRHSKVVYINPDGSTVEIETSEKGKKCQVKNRYGYITKSVIYGKDGNIDHKNVYTYERVKTKDGKYVYKIKQEKYKYNGSDYDSEPSSPKAECGYAYPSNDNGKIKYSKTEPAASEIGTPKSTMKKLTVDTTGDGSEKAVTGADTSDKSNKGPVVVTEKNVQSTIDNHEDFVLSKGSTITEENNGSLYAYGSETSEVYFEYDQKEGVYYIKNKKGQYINATNTVIRDKNSAKLQGAYIDPELVTKTKIK